MLVDIVIQPFYNKMPQVMKLYDALSKQMSYDVRIIIVNNGSIDGMRPSNFHQEDYVNYVSSDVRINESLLLSHAILKESKSKYINLISYNSVINEHYISNLLKLLEKTDKDIIMGGVESLKSRRSTIKIADKRSVDNLKIPNSFFCENIVLDRNMILKSGLFDRRLKSVSNSVKMLCYHMIKFYKAEYDIDKTFSVTLPTMPTDSNDRVLNKYLIDYEANTYAFKNYIDKEVYGFAGGKDKNDNILYNTINALIILPTKQNDNLENLIREQKSKKDKLYISNLPKYMSKRLGYIFQKFSQFNRIIVIHENASFKYPYFIDDFKLSSFYNTSTIMASNEDFSIVELRPSTATQNMSISVPRQFLWEPGLNEIMNWDELVKKFATLQPDQKISDLFGETQKKANIVNTAGDGGPAKTAVIPKKHKTSWYDWME